MNILDFIIIGLLAFLLVKGIFRGFFREISSLAGVIVGLVLGNYYYLRMAEFLKPNVPFEKFLPVVSFVIIFLMVFFAFNLLGILLHYLFKRLFIGWFDRGLGVAFALVKGILISYLLIVLLTFFVPATAPLIAKSKAARVVIVTYQHMSRFVSPDIYVTWKQRIFSESKKLGKVISDSKEAIKKIPQVLPEKKETQPPASQ